MHLKKERIVITGGTGFLGQHVYQNLIDRGIPKENVFAIGKSHYDLTEPRWARQLFRDLKPTVVIHLAAVVGGIGANRQYPGTFFYKNLLMGTLLMEMARKHDVKKLTAVGTICAYPKFTPIPFKEESLWDGYPEETNAPYGLAKKMLLVQAQAYRKEFDFNAIYLLPVNLYGPGDNFQPESSHVIPALIKKCVDARNKGDSNITVWGTGRATREFLYVKDAAQGIVMATEKYDGYEPCNLGAGFEISIRELVSLVADLTGYKGKIIWDSEKPDGQPRRLLDTRRAKTCFDFVAKTDFCTGLRETIDYYRSVCKG
jgi:GDP-L-fucose synthase